MAPDGREMKIGYDGALGLWVFAIAGNARPATARRLRDALAQVANDRQDAPWIVALADQVEAPLA